MDRQNRNQSINRREALKRGAAMVLAPLLPAEETFLPIADRDGNEFREFRDLILGQLTAALGIPRHLVFEPVNRGELAWHQK